MPRDLTCARAHRHGGATLRLRAAVPVVLAALGIGGMVGCATPPSAGDVVHAQVNLRIGEPLFMRATSAGATLDDAGGNPSGLMLAIRSLVADGATVDDARAGRLLMASCRWFGDSGARFAVRLPAGVSLPEGNHVELELLAGAELDGEDVGMRARFLRLLPHRPTGRTHCDPAANATPP